MRAKQLFTGKYGDIILALIVGATFYLLGKGSNSYRYLNYTFGIGSALLQGHLGVPEAPSWLNELIPLNGQYYSAFPLGAVLSVLPLSLITGLGVLSDYPATFLAAALAGICALLTYRYTTVRADFTFPKRILLGLWLVCGTWFMTNLAFAGSWQLALGFAVAGELGALYFAVRGRPLLAGLCFAVAFGNRTELLTLAPIFILLLVKPHISEWQNSTARKKILQQTLLFGLFPLMLGLATLAYNHARFGYWTDFGYARIPGVLEERLYQDGIFSLLPIAENANQMLWRPWDIIPNWPYLVPSGFGGSIFLASPFLLMLFRKPQGSRLRVYSALSAIAIITAILWLHGNPGGWQFSYRYALVLLPWFLVLFVEYLPSRVTRAESSLLGVSLAINLYATYLFLWTDIIQP